MPVVFGSTHPYRDTRSERDPARYSGRYVHGMLSHGCVSEHHNLGKRAKAAVLRIERWARAYCLDTLSG